MTRPDGQNLGGHGKGEARSQLGFWLRTPKEGSWKFTEMAALGWDAHWTSTQLLAGCWEDRCRYWPGTQGCNVIGWL